MTFAEELEALKIWLTTTTLLFCGFDWESTGISNRADPALMCVVYVALKDGDLVFFTLSVNVYEAWRQDNQVEIESMQKFFTDFLNDTTFMKVYCASNPFDVRMLLKATWEETFQDGQAFQYPDGKRNANNQVWSKVDSDNYKQKFENVQKDTVEKHYPFFFNSSTGGKVFKQAGMEQENKVAGKCIADQLEFLYSWAKKPHDSNLWESTVEYCIIDAIAAIRAAVRNNKMPQAMQKLDDDHKEVLKNLKYTDVVSQEVDQDLAETWEDQQLTQVYMIAEHPSSPEPEEAEESVQSPTQNSDESEHAAEPPAKRVKFRENSEETAHFSDMESEEENDEKSPVYGSQPTPVKNALKCFRCDEPAKKGNPLHQCATDGCGNLFHYGCVEAIHDSDETCRMAPDTCTQCGAPEVPEEPSQSLILK